MQPNVPSPPAEHVTITQHFERYLQATYTDPPSAIDASEEFRDQFWQLRDAFFAGCLVAATSPMDMLPELLDHAEFAAERARMSKSAGVSR